MIAGLKKRRFAQQIAPDGDGREDNPRRTPIQ